jgi:hypothetical protein
MEDLYIYLVLGGVGESTGILVGISLNLQIALGSMDILTMFILPIHEHIYIFFNSFQSCCVVSLYKSSYFFD